MHYLCYRDRSRDRKHRDRDRDRSSDRKDRHRDRSRSRSRDRKNRDREKERDRTKDTEKKAPIDDAAEQERLRQKKEIDDLTKDQRTVFVSQLTIKTTESHVQDYFSLIGKVNNVIMIRDKFTGKHKGFAYVEMADLETIPICLQLNGIPPDFQKFPILVKASEAEKNFLAKKEPVVTNIAVEKQLLPGADCKIYVGNLHVNISEQDLMTVLSRFGNVESVNLQRDEVQISKGYAFVRYSKAEEATRALNELAGLELAGKTIKVGYVNDPTSNPTATTAAAAGASGNWKLDDDEGVGMQMNSHSRSMLMAKLGAAAGIAPPQPVPTNIYGPGSAAPPIGGVPSSCIMIKNMFVLEQETEPNWEDDIKDDVIEECHKYGKTNHCYIENKIPGGFVYVRFTSFEAAAEAAKSLNGRWFAGRMITVSYLNPAEYQAKFNPK